jgi:adenine-specific DNA-methyltransferase
MATVESLRVQASNRLKPTARAPQGQYFTPLSIANFMAAMAPAVGPAVKILDPGAGIGILSAALIDKLLKDDPPPYKISVTAYEIDQSLHPYLEATMKLCQKACADAGVKFHYSISGQDFIEAGRAW